jgi:hypothetical protein
MKKLIMLMAYLLITVSSYSQTTAVRTTIQDYATVIALQAETSIPRLSDKVAIKANNGNVYYWDATSVLAHDGDVVIKQTSIATGRWIKSGGGTNTRYGTIAPLILTTDRKGDEYLRTSTGDNSVAANESYLFDGVKWNIRPLGISLTESLSITETGLWASTPGIQLLPIGNSSQNLGSITTANAVDLSTPNVTSVNSGAFTLTTTGLTTLKAGRYKFTYSLGVNPIVTSDVFSVFGTKNNVFTTKHGVNFSQSITNARPSTISGSFILDLVIGDLVQLRVTEMNNNATTCYLTSYALTVDLIGAFAYSSLNTYVGATAVTAGVTGGVPVASAGQQLNVLQGNGTWVAPVTTMPLNAITASTATNTALHANLQQNHNWNLSGTTIGLNISEGTAQAGGAGATLFKVNTLAGSTIKPFTIGALNTNVIDVTALGLVTFGASTITQGQVFQSGVTTGNGVAITQSALTSGNALNVLSNSTAKLTNSAGLGIQLSGALSTASQTTYGANISNANTGTTETNVGIQVSATGATNNYGLLVSNGNVGIGTTTPASLLQLINVTNPEIQLSNNGTSRLRFGVPTTAGNIIGGSLLNEVVLGNDNGSVALGAGAGTANAKLRILSTGEVGINVATPLTNFHVIGSQSGSIVNIATVTYSVLITDYHIRLTLAGNQTITLPTASTFTGRFIMLSNPTGFNKAYASNIIGTDQVATNVILSYEVGILLQSDGTNWNKVASSGEKSCTKYKYFTAGAWNVGSIIIGNLEFQFNAAAVGASPAINVRCVGSLTSMNGTQTTQKYAGLVYTGSNAQNNSYTTAYSLLTPSTAQSSIDANYLKLVYCLQDRGGLGSWEVTVMNDGSTNVSMEVKYTKP